MKKVYVVSVQWYEDERWRNTPLHVFSNKRAAESYVKTKRELAEKHPDTQDSRYYYEELKCWNRNFLKFE